MSSLIKLELTLRKASRSLCLPRIQIHSRSDDAYRYSAPEANLDVLKDEDQQGQLMIYLHSWSGSAEELLSFKARSKEAKVRQREGVGCFHLQN